MADYTAIAQVSKKLAELLQTQLVPELIPDVNGVSLCSPDERENTSLGIFLYDICESEEIRRSGMINGHPSRQVYPPIYINLYYMITAYSTSDLKFRMIQEEQILGRIIQYFHDYPIIPLREVSAETLLGTDMQVQMMVLDAEQKLKLWNSSKQAYHLSLFYKVSPVAVESARVKEITRVREVNINLKNIEKGN